MPADSSRARAPIARADVEAWLERLWIAAEGASLRREERRKAELLRGLLDEVAQACARVARSRELVLVDAAAGKAYAGLLAAQLVIAPAGRRARVIAIERETDRVAACRAAAARLDAPGVEVSCAAGLVADRSLWPPEPSIVVALHACGGASDDVIDAAAAARARHLLLVPCCTGESADGAARARAAAEVVGVPRQAGVRRAFIESWIAAERTLRLERAGFETEVVPVAPASVSPYHLVFRARRVREPRRMREAAARLERMQQLAASGAPVAAPVRATR